MSCSRTQLMVRKGSTPTPPFRLEPNRFTARPPCTHVCIFYLDNLRDVCIFHVCDKIIIHLLGLPLKHGNSPWKGLNLKETGPRCSKLTTSLINDLLKFQT